MRSIFTFLLFAVFRGGSFVVPVISLSTCERSEKERIVRLDAYTLTITFTLRNGRAALMGIGTKRRE